MKFYRPKLLIATLEGPQTRLLSKFGGLPWGLPTKRWSRCQQCGRLMSLLAQLTHDPPALDLGGPDHVLHLFQCQDPGCLGIEPGEGNDAVMVPIAELRDGLTQVPENEELGGCDAVMINGVVPSHLRLLVGELWIDGWLAEDDEFSPELATHAFDCEKWMELPDSVTNYMFGARFRTKMGGIPYWTGNGPLDPPPPGYEFLFQLDTLIQFEGEPPKPDACGAMLVSTDYLGEESALRPRVIEQYFKPAPENKKPNAPWSIGVDNIEPGFTVNITNFGSDGTAYVFINRRTRPASVMWRWTR